MLPGFYPGTPRREGRFRKAIISVVGLIGYILSPVSWWNDAFVNIPLSLLVAKVLSFFGISIRIGFILGYWGSNALGIFLMAWSGSRWLRVGGFRSLLISIFFAIIYTILVVSLLGRMGY